jgi:ribosome-associated translation inhibitor RaiA
MRLQIGGPRAKLSKVLRAHVDGRVRLALARFGERIGPVMVRFSELAGEKCCRIEVGLRPRVIRVEGMHGDPFGAANHAISRISSSIARTLEREREGTGWSSTS